MGAMPSDKPKALRKIIRRLKQCYVAVAERSYPISLIVTSRPSSPERMMARVKAMMERAYSGVRRGRVSPSATAFVKTCPARRKLLPSSGFTSL